MTPFVEDLCKRHLSITFIKVLTHSLFLLSLSSSVSESNFFLRRGVTQLLPGKVLEWTNFEMLPFFYIFEGGRGRPALSIEIGKRQFCAHFQNI